MAREGKGKVRVGTELGGIKILAAGCTSDTGRGDDRTECVTHTRSILLLYGRTYEGREGKWQGLDGSGKAEPLAVLHMAGAMIEFEEGRAVDTDGTQR